jgi:hypothetical protein
MILNNRNMEVLLPEAGMMEKKEKMKQDSENTSRALPQSLLHAPTRHDGVLHRPDQTTLIDHFG